ncbi:dead box atp-dependent rna helicase-like protein [Dermatophagoides farinae]|uniref:Dead box atp-dependent rna helicase-like protein n=2 Tax=Dermatophagoides farinae TaxID=6954 RepID=A0A9D4P0B2_DERFA|nr:dead box atp-dependent rna helicase-like protein [Dermatophagoides farinae]
MENNLGNTIYQEHCKVKETREKRRQKMANPLNPNHLNKKIISWTGDKKLFHYYGRRYNTRDVPLISKFFLKETSNGQYMTVHNFDTNPSLMSCDHPKSFDSLGLGQNLTQSIYDTVNSGQSIFPSTIQSAVIPLLLRYRNVVFSAETGSGKTIAYLAPLIQLIQQTKVVNSNRNRKCPFGLIVLPSRELTEQVGDVAKQLCANTDVGVATMIGGLPKHLHQTGIDLVITTIGIIESHLNNGVYSLRNLNHIVFDEADTLLDDSFAYETMDLLGKLNINHGQNHDDDKEQCNIESDESHVLNGTQLICASATMPMALDSTIGSLVDMQDDIDQISTKNLHTLHPNIKHRFFRVNRHKKDIKLFELLFESQAQKSPVIVFANRAKAVDWLFKFINENGFNCVRLTGTMDEEERYQSFQLFQKGEYDILVATDLGSRGLDTSRVKHVINFDCPHYVSDYIHRSGRTGRLGSSFIGHVSTFVSFKPDAYMLMELERALRLGEPITTVNANIKAQISQHRVDKWQKIQRNS